MEKNDLERFDSCLFLNIIFILFSVVILLIILIPSGRQPAENYKDTEGLLELLLSNEEIDRWEVEYFKYKASPAKYSMSFNFKDGPSIYVDDKKSIKSLIEEYENLISRLEE